MAALSALTPAAHRRTFVDDRLETVPFDRPTDLACITVETYTARRAYQIAAEYRRRGVRAVLGGFHPTLLPDEATAHADAIVIGEVEPVWAELLDDAAAGTLKPRYQGAARPELTGITYDRAIYAGRPYGHLALVETSRGCRFSCEFCSIAGFFRQTFRTRPAAEITRELRTLPHRNIFFVDDNIGAEPARLRELCDALLPLRRRWIGQLSLHAAQDDALLRLMRRSGCEGVLIGFESLNPQNLAAMGKSVNAGGIDYAPTLARLRHHGLSVYATFVFGYDHDTEESFRETLRFARAQKFFFTAFNHLVPFPGTPLYDRLRAEGRLLSDAWWLDPKFCFGDVVFQPKNVTPQQLAELCHRYRRLHYAPGSVLERGWDFQANCRTPYKALMYLAGNLGQGREIRRRQGLPLGFSREAES